MAELAIEVAQSLLAADLPRRWAHSLGVAVAAQALAPILGDDAHTVWAAAVLHDVGYAPALAVTGFHPLDGARHLRTVEGVDDRVVRLVAHHSFAVVEAGLRGLDAALSQEFPQLDEPLLTEALVYCDMTTTPDGARTTSRGRVAEILDRYGPDSVVGEFIRTVEPDIHAAVGRVQERAAAAGLELGL